MIARVEPLTLTRALRGPFDYRLREDQNGVGVGSVLRIPFGRQRTLGVVVEIAERSALAADRLIEPEEVLASSLPPDLVELALWMAREYCSTAARALALVLGPGGGEKTRSKTVLCGELTDAGRAALAGSVQLTDRQRHLLAALERDGPTVAAELGTPALRRLETRGLVRVSRQVQRRRPARHQVGSASSTPPPLTGDQELALGPILDGIKTATRDRFLLHGVTGSGKTEVYLRAVQATLAAGRTAIVLVPEIALTPQALHRFETRFGELVAVLHSGLGPGQRHDEWQRLASGQARVCVGARSAIFAPLAEIGLIVVDEEHEASFKNEGDPRYDARTTAERRALAHGAVLVFGSATPRPESAVGLTHLKLQTRIDGRAMPPVEVLDMRSMHNPLHPKTRLALSDLRRSGGKAIVLLNRRGWSNFLSCQACGHVWMCPNCEVTLVLHRAGSYVACHHCGHRERVPSRCASCGSVSLARHGAGTERLEHELREAVGGSDFPVFRLDADSAALNARARTLEQFGAADAGVLVGTQMVAKGHDFPDVTLGVVIDADQTLRFPDFRAEERTFALVTQLAGRAGRGERGGRVLVQTIAPDARAIRFAAAHDADGFLADELARRQALGYPPFCSLIRIVCSCEERADAAAVAAALSDAIAPPGASVLGPAPLFTLRGRGRSQLVVKATDRRAAIDAVGEAVDGLARFASKRSVSVSVDVDPQ